MNKQSLNTLFTSLLNTAKVSRTKALLGTCVTEPLTLNYFIWLSNQKDSLGQAVHQNSEPAKKFLQKNISYTD